MSRGTQGHNQSLNTFAYGTITFLSSPFQGLLARVKVSYSVPDLDQAATPYNPLKA